VGRGQAAGGEGAHSRVVGHDSDFIEPPDFVAERLNELHEIGTCQLARKLASRQVPASGCTNLTWTGLARCGGDLTQVLLEKRQCLGPGVLRGLRVIAVPSRIHKRMVGTWVGMEFVPLPVLGQFGIERAHV